MEQTTVLQEGFDGVLFPVDNQKGKVMIVFTGSDGGLKTAKQLAAYYQNNGIPALALGYFRTKHTGKNLSHIPLEYIEKAIAWLKAKGYEKTGIDSLSKGTEYAMCAAIKFSDISCLILRAPSYYVSEGLRNGQPSGISCWCFRNKELPYTAYRSRKINKLMLVLKSKEFFLLEINTGKEIQPASVIPVEKIHAPILIISTKADTIWPSAESGKVLAERLKTHNHPYAFRHVCFKHLSHMLVPIPHKSTLVLMKLMFQSEKNYPEQCHAERDALVKEISNWISNVWQ